MLPREEPYRFSYSHFFAPIDWTVKWFEYDRATQEPRTMLTAFEKLLHGTPVKTEKTTRLSYTLPAGVRPEYFATVADGTVDVPDGDYVLSVTSDDGVRVWVDGKQVIDNWTYHVPTLNTAALHLSGAHAIHVEHFQIDGFAQLDLDLQPKAVGGEP